MRKARVIQAKERLATVAKTTEHQIQKSLIRWANVMKLNHPELELLFAVPNGGWRGKASAGKIKAEGAKAGVPDLFLAYPAHGYSGMFIEMKTEKGRLSELQKVWIDRLSSVGYLCVVAYGLDEAIESLEKYLCINGKTFTA
jgi:hypothetical protein